MPEVISSTLSAMKCRLVVDPLKQACPAGDEAPSLAAEVRRPAVADVAQARRRDVVNHTRWCLKMSEVISSTLSA